MTRRPAVLDVLRLRDYRYFWLSNVFSDFGFEIRLAAVNWLVLELTDSQLWVGLVSGITAVPIVLFSLLGGVVTDRADRRVILIVTRTVVATLAFLIAYLATVGLVQPWHLLLIAITNGVTMAFSSPTLRAFVVDLVGRRYLLTANSLASFAADTGNIAGPAVAGYLIGARGIDSVFYLVGGIYVVSIALMARVTRRERPQMQGGRSILSGIAEGLRYARQTPPIPALLLIIVTGFFGIAVVPLIPVYARDVLGVGPVGFGIMGAALGAGFLAGSFLTTVMSDPPRKVVLMLVAAALWDVCMVSFAFSRTFPLSVALLFIMGVGGVVHTNLVVTMLQQITSDEMRGRVMSLYSIAMASFPMGFILAGALAATISNEFPLVLGAILSTPVILLIYLRSPGLRRA